MKMNTTSSEGMVTIEGVYNANGSLILPKGVVLNVALIGALLKQNITVLEVDYVEEVAEQKNSSSELSEEYKDHVNLLFLKHRGPFMKELQACLLK